MATTEVGGTLPSVCPLDCPDTCSLLLRVLNDRGETHLVARITDAVLPGVLYTPTCPGECKTRSLRPWR